MKKTIIICLLYISFLFLLIPNMFAQEESLPCIEEEILFKVGDITLSGTLTIPKRIGRHPAVILISGSFADNRDAEISGFKPFQIIADHLSSNGIAVVRYDDRGVGKSAGKHTYQYTINELADDVLSAINFLKSREDIDSNQIGLIGHSLGGMIAPLVASKSKEVAFIISLAGPVTKPDEINIKYRKTTLTNQGKTQQEIDKAIEIEKQIIEVTRTGDGFEHLVRNMKEVAKSDFKKLNENRKMQYKNFDSYFQSTWYGLMLPFINTPFMKSFYNHKPVPPLEKITCSALFLFAEKDHQIKINESGAIIIQALYKVGNNDYTISVIPNVDHYFVEDWSKKEFGKGFLNTLSNWIQEHVYFLQ